MPEPRSKPGLLGSVQVEKGDLLLKWLLQTTELLPSPRSPEEMTPPPSPLTCPHNFLCLARSLKDLGLDGMEIGPRGLELSKQRTQPGPWCL